VTSAMKQMWAAGEPALGAWLSIPSSFSAEAVAHQGFDYVCIDMQHGLIDYSDVPDMLLAIHSANTTPIVRVPSNDFAMINKVLDAGALGIIVPMIETVADVEAAVRACRYPPEGARSFGPTRAPFVAGPDYFRNANAKVACIPMIETLGALDHLDEILALPGVDAVYVGPNDLSLALGQQPGADNPRPYQDAYRKVAAACVEHGVIAGIHAKAKLASKHVATGYQMITVSSDLSAMTAACARDLGTARGT
jgi:4-hydroxy-2-oxoheptanedioate aldolase